MKSIIKKSLLFFALFFFIFCVFLAYQAGVRDAMRVSATCSQKVAPEELNCYMYIESKGGIYSAQKKCYIAPWLTSRVKE